MKQLIFECYIKNIIEDAQKLSIDDFCGVFNDILLCKSRKGEEITARDLDFVCAAIVVLGSNIKKSREDIEFLARKIQEAEELLNLENENHGKAI